MTLFNLIGSISAIALSLPVIMLLTTRLAWYKTFPALFIYYTCILAYIILLLGYADLGENFMYNLGVLNNFLDTPLMLLFLIYFSKTPSFRKKLFFGLLAFAVFEVVSIIIYGFSLQAITIILAPGLLTVLVITTVFFIHQVKIAVMYHKAVGKAVMVASLLFAYVGYCFVYTVFYLIKPVYKDDAHLVYFLITIVSCILMAAGIFIERKRVNQLAELKTTRQELKAIYGGNHDKKKIANPLEAAIMKFDKKEWN
jgi:hypothetical protein